MQNSPETSAIDWLAEMEIEDATFVDGAKLLDGLTPQQFAASFEDDFRELYSSEGFYLDSCSNNSTISSPIEGPQVCCDTPAKGSIPEAASFSDLVSSFHNLNSMGDHRQWDTCTVGSEQPKANAMKPTNLVNQKRSPKTQRGSKRGTTPSNQSPKTKEHVIAERKRRAKLSQQFIALTALVPGIKKMDKATVLDDSIRYLKHMQERVKTLEEQSSKKTMESAVFVKKFQLHSDSESCSSDRNFTDEPQPLPQIEAKISDRNVLIHIHCENRKRALVTTLEEIEKLNLSVFNSSVIPFGDSTLDITLMAQMDGGFIMTAKDLVRSLHSSLNYFGTHERASESA